MIRKLSGIGLVTPTALDNRSIHLKGAPADSVKTTTRDFAGQLRCLRVQICALTWDLHATNLPERIVLTTNGTSVAAGKAGFLDLRCTLEAGTAVVIDGRGPRKILTIMVDLIKSATTEDSSYAQLAVTLRAPSRDMTQQNFIQQPRAYPPYLEKTP